MNELMRAGAPPGNKQARFTPIWVGSLRSGLVTNRSPLIGSTAPRLMEKFYGTSGDLFIAGSNAEISSRFSLIRRPGNSVYNSNSFTGVDSFYEFRIENGTIKVIADTTSAVKDITGSNNITVLNKSVGAGQTYFQSVLNTLFMGNGVDQKKYVFTTNTWAASTNFTPALTYSIGNQVVPGFTIIDSNGNLQVLTTAGLSGTTQPTWSTVFGNTTTDNHAVWTCYGSPIQNWGTATPTSAPSPVNAAITTVPYPSWIANTFFAPQILAIVDTNNNIQQLTTSGTTGLSQPTWNVTVGGTTTDSTAIWTNLGTANWQANNAYTVGQVVAVNSHSHTITVGSFTPSATFFPRIRGGGPITVSYSELFYVTQAGTSAGSQPTWQTGFGSIVSDGTVVWKNIGPKVLWGSVGPGQTLSTINAIQDTNGNLQMPTTLGKSGGTTPAWSITQGATTPDGTQVWQNMGPVVTGAANAANTGTWVYAYAYKNSIANTVGSASAVSSPILLEANSYIVVQGLSSTDPQDDTIVLFRTVQGGTTNTNLLFWLAEFPNDPDVVIWSFNDTFPDSSLNEFLSAPINGVNNPPPAGLIHLTYHLNRIWGSVGNVVFYSNPLTTTLGAGTEQFTNASNYFVFPSVVTRLEPTSSGLMVFTTSDIHMISGQGTPTSILYDYPFVAGIGLLSYNALTKSGSTFYLFTTSKKLISLDPSSGYLEIGNPIGDQLLAFSPSSAYVTWHDGGATDTALYIANGSTGWFRLAMNPNSSVESPTIWSPFATIQGGLKALQSVEVSPGNKQMLLGPVTTGSILKRDLSVSTDNGTPYAANATIGSIVLAEPGQMAQIAFIAADSVAVAGSSRPAISVLFDEALPYYSGAFYPLLNIVNDPPKLASSISLLSNRYYTNQTQAPTWCRHMQIQIAWPVEAFANELLSLAIYGDIFVEK